MRPVSKHVISPRLAVYAALAAACGVALWIATTRGRLLARPVVLPALALATLVPASWRLHFSADPVRPEFFSHALYKLCIPKGETLAIFPFGRWGDSMVWQAESSFCFRMGTWGGISTRSGSCSATRPSPRCSSSGRPAPVRPCRSSCHM